MPLLDIDGAGRLVDPAAGSAPIAADSFLDVAAECISAGADELLVRTTDSPTRSQLGALGLLATERAAPLLVRAEVDVEATFAALLDAGVDRVVIEKAALADPDVISRLAARFGMESVAVKITALAEAGGWRVIRGRDGPGTEWDAVDWARVVEAQGGGELVLESGERGRALDLPLLEAVTGAVARPAMAVVTGDVPEDAIDALLIGDADAVALEAGPLGLAESIRQIKRMAAEHGLPVRG